MKTRQLSVVNTYLIGLGGFAIEVLEALKSSRQPERLAGVFDDDTRVKQMAAAGLEYLGTVTDLLTSGLTGARFVLGYEEIAQRERVYRELDAVGMVPVTAVHRSAVISGEASMEPGAYVAAHAFVGPRAVVGRGAVLNVGTSIGHHAHVGAFAVLCPGTRVSGHAKIGDGAFLGSNSGVGPGVRIGACAKLAACSFAFRDTPDCSLSVGIPARVTGL